MTYLQDIKVGKYLYRYKVRSYRDNGKVKQEREYIGKVINKEGKEVVIPPRRLLPSHVSEVRRYGLFQILYNIAKEWDIAETIEDVSPIAKKNDYGSAILLLSINHVTDRKALDKIGEWYRYSALYPHLGDAELFSKKRLLDAMDSLVYEDEYENLFDFTFQITQKIRAMEARLIGENSNAGLIYDITEVASYSENNPYADLGYSPVNENNKLVKVCLVTERETHLPVHIFIVNGNLPDKSTVREMLSRLSAVEIDKKKSCMIMDRGMMSEENMVLYKDEGLEVIAGMTARRKDVEDLIASVNESEFIQSANAIKRAGGGITYVLERPFKTDKIEGRNLICLVPDLQNNVRAARFLAIHEITKEIERRNENKWHKLPSNDIERVATNIVTPIKSFVEINVDADKRFVGYRLNENKLKKQVNLDGRFSLFSTNTELTKEEIFDAYFSRDAIEKAFEIYKGELDLPPIRHWKHKRILSYLQICFISYLMQSYLMYKVKKAGLTMGWTDLKFMLERMQQVVLDTPTGQKIEIANITSAHKKLMEKIGYPIM